MYVHRGGAGDDKYGINTSEANLWRFFQQPTTSYGETYCEMYKPPLKTPFGFGNSLILGLSTKNIKSHVKLLMLYFNEEPIVSVLSGDREKFGTKLEPISAVYSEPEDYYWKSIQVN